MAVPALIALLLVPSPGGLKEKSDRGRVVYETETEYQYARVIERDDGSRRLELNEGQSIHSLYKPDTALSTDYWNDQLILPWATGRTEPPDRVAILGNAAGTTARAYRTYFPQTVVDGVEIDGELSDIGRRYFDMRGGRLRVHTADARPFLRQSTQKYDALLLDAYRQPYVPFYLTTREFFELARSRLAEGGAVVVNVGQPEGQTALERTLAATLRTVFPYVLRDRATTTNTLLVASTVPISPDLLRGTEPRMPRELRPVVTSAAGRLMPPLTGGDIYTDDKAPVEWLVDSSILQYAAGD